jgi:hypothetical protein
MKYLISTILLIFVISGCSSNNNSISIPKHKIIKVDKNLPKWVNNPKVIGKTCDVGYAKFRDTRTKYFAINLATIIAKAALSEQISSRVTNEYNYSIKCVNDFQCQKNISDNLVIKSNNTIRNFKTLHQYTDEINNIYYIHGCI